MAQLVSVCQQLIIYKGGGAAASWQNYYSNQNVGGYEFQPFSVSTIQVNRSADEGGVVVEAAATHRIITQFESAVNDQDIIELKILQANGAVTSGFGGFQMIAMFTGVALTMTNNLTQVRLSVGSAIDAVSGDVPGRKLTLADFGELPKL